MRVAEAPQLHLKGHRRRHQAVAPPPPPPERRANRLVKRESVSRTARLARVANTSQATAPVIPASNAVPPPPLPPPHPPLHPRPAPHPAKPASANPPAKPARAALISRDTVPVIVVSSVVLMWLRRRRRRRRRQAEVVVRGRSCFGVRGWRGGCWSRVDDGSEGWCCDGIFFFLCSSFLFLCLWDGWSCIGIGFAFAFMIVRLRLNLISFDDVR